MIGVPPLVSASDLHLYVGGKQMARRIVQGKLLNPIVDEHKNVVYAGEDIASLPAKIRQGAKIPKVHETRSRGIRRRQLGKEVQA